MESERKDYRYSLDGESFNYSSMNELIDDVMAETDNPIGVEYMRGEAEPMTAEKIIDDNIWGNMFEELGECYDSDFTTVSEESITELRNLIVEWTKKHVNCNYWTANNVEKLIKGDLE